MWPFEHIGRLLRYKQEHTKGTAMSSERKEQREVEDILGNLELPERSREVRLYKIGPPTYEGQVCMGIGDGALRRWPPDEMPVWEELKNICIANWGGGRYALRVTGADGKFIDTRNFNISVEECPPKTKAEKTKVLPQERIALFERPPAADSGLVAATQTMVQAMIAGANQNLEALKLMMQQGDADRREATRVTVDAVTKIAEAGRDSANLMIEALKASKAEMMELMKAMVADAKSSTQSMLEMMMSTFMSGLNLGSNIGAPPKSEVAEILGTFAEAFKSTMEAKAQTSTEEINKMVTNAAKAAVSKVAAKLPTSAAVPQAVQSASEDAMKGTADNVLRTLIETLSTKPAETQLLQIFALVPREVVLAVLESGQVDALGEWLNEHGTSSLVDELQALLTDEENREWLRERINLEAAALQKA